MLIQQSRFGIQPTVNASKHYQVNTEYRNILSFYYKYVLKTIFTGPNKHQSAVTCLQFNSRFVITSSDDGTVKLWDVRTGEFIRNLVTLDSGGSGGVVWRIRYDSITLVFLLFLLFVFDLHSFSLNRISK